MQTGPDTDANRRTGEGEKLVEAGGQEIKEIKNRRSRDHEIRSVAAPRFARR